jgi:DNA-binding transcriptional LysR family regulator
MPDAIHFRLKVSLLALAEELDYTRAAKRLETSPAQLREDVAELERRLCIKLVQGEDQQQVYLTEEGLFLAKLFQSFSTVRNGISRKSDRHPN